MHFLFISKVSASEVSVIDSRFDPPVEAIFSI